MIHRNTGHDLRGFRVGRGFLPFEGGAYDAQHLPPAAVNLHAQHAQADDLIGFRIEPICLGVNHCDVHRPIRSADPVFVKRHRHLHACRDR